MNGVDAKVGAEAKVGEEKFPHSKLRVLRQCLAWLRARPGEKFLIPDLALALGHAEPIIGAALSAYPHRPHSLLRKERCASGEATSCWRYWIGAPQAADDAGRVRDWLQQRRHAATPAAIAGALQLQAPAVMTVLEEMHAQGEAVRCELPLREGAERFEYRLLGAI